MDVDVDHYLVLGLPSGEEGAKLSVDDIKKAYRSKALELHPDKRPGNKQALADFQRLHTSYEILKDEKARKFFDDLLRVKREQQRRQSERSSKRDAKRQKMVSDLEEREQAAFAPDPAAKEREEEERIAKKLREEIARIRAMHTKKGANMASAVSRESSGVKKEGMDTTGARVDKEKVVKVSWEKVGEDYTAEGLRELFSKFGEVDDVVIKSSKKKGSALVVMATKDAAVAATGSLCGYLSNPLSVLLLLPPKAAETSSAMSSPTAFEDAVLMKLQADSTKLIDLRLTTSDPFRSLRQPAFPLVPSSGVIEPSCHSGSGYGDYLSSGHSATIPHSASNTDGGDGHSAHSGSGGYGDYLNMAQGFLKKQ